jgi:GMP synthase-like glutamine amidotransferase
MVDLAKKYRKPTIGICLGAEAIAVYFGSELKEMPVRRVGNIRINLDPGFAEAAGQKGRAMVYEFHKWRIEDVKEPLVCLATSKDRVELFRHKTLPIWGMQFHPEVKRLDNSGHLIFEHILRRTGLL